MTPVDLTESVTDAECLGAMVEHYASTLISSKPAKAWLETRAISEAVAERFRLGFADRSFGKSLPRSSCDSGRAIRKRLAGLGVTLDSGHERFRGCVTVPIVSGDGEMVGLQGTRIYTSLPAGTPREVWLHDMPGGLFTPNGLGSADLVIALTIPVALTLVSAGIEAVVAPGRPEGFTDREIEEIGQSSRRLVVVTGSKGDRESAQLFSGGGGPLATVYTWPLSTLAARVADGFCSRGGGGGVAVDPHSPSAPTRASCPSANTEVAVDPHSPFALTGSDVPATFECSMLTGAPVGPASSTSGALGATIVGEEVEEPCETVARENEVAVQKIPGNIGETPALAGMDVHLVQPQPARCIANSSAPADSSEMSGSASNPSAPADPAEIRLNTGTHTWRIRGATRAKGYETLKANVMVTDTTTGRFHVDTIDLYSARQRSGFIAALVDELHVPVATVAAEIDQALLATEQALDKAATDSPSGPPEPSAAERDVAMEMLTSPDLVGQIVSDICELGIVGEEDNALLLYLALVSRKLDKPLSVMVQSAPSAGKSTLADRVASLVPAEDQVTYSALTGQALYYLGAGDLSHKVLCVAEEEGAAKATYAIKLLVSSGKLAIASTGKDPETGRLVTSSYEVAGPVSLLMTTTAPHVDEELASRLVAISVCESVSQTRKIHEVQRASYSKAGLIEKAGREAVIARHHVAQRLIQSLPVVIPGVEELAFSDATTRSRRDHDKYLSLICASALLHQFQRRVRTIQNEDSPISYIEATPADVALADRLAKGVIIRDCADLPPATASLLTRLASWAGNGHFTRRAAREALGLGDTQAKVHLARLVELEYAVATYVGRTVSYQLCWDDPVVHRSGGKGAPSHVGDRTTEGTEVHRDSPSGETEPIRPGEKAIRSGGGRGVVGHKSGSGRGHANGSSAQVKAKKSPQTKTTRPDVTYGDEDDPYSNDPYGYDVAVSVTGGSRRRGL